ncbi:hypothetical protein SAMN06298212_12933, partial [Ruaniaceae bacterium KH17]
AEDAVVVNDGTFNLRKIVDGVDAASFPAGTVFPVTATWEIDGEEFTESFDLPADGSVVPSGLDLPEGTVVSLVEGDLPDAPEGYSFVSSGVSADTVTILADGNADIAWSVTNTYKADELVVTGVSGAAEAAIAGALLVLAGGGLLLIRRRWSAV